MDHDELDFDAALRRARLTVPAERRAAMLEAYRNMQAMLKVLDDPLAYEDEPAVLPRLGPGAGR
ncbi:MAG TPA: hypothetical protein VFA12_08130 [Stellaceae bacterium]|nr:hypothetical protein [Stellaceae bacterium]